MPQIDVVRRTTPVAPAAARYLNVEGTLKYQEPLAGLGGESGPSGYYVELPRGKRVTHQGVTSNKLFVSYSRNDAGGQALLGLLGRDAKVKASGRVEVGTYGGVETPEGRYLILKDPGVQKTGGGTKP